MIRTIREKNERVFTIELGSQGDLKNVSLDADRKVIIEGSLGPLKRARFVEDLVLEVVGENGQLRLDLSLSDIVKAENMRSAPSKVGRRSPSDDDERQTELN